MKDPDSKPIYGGGSEAAQFPKDSIAGAIIDRRVGNVTTVSGLEMFANRFGRGELDTHPMLDHCKQCGHEAGFTDGQRRGQSDNYTVGVECSNTSCGIRTPEHYRTREDAAYAWNRKPGDPAKRG